MPSQFIVRASLVLLLLGSAPTVTAADEVAEALATLKSVGAGSHGSSAARDALQKITDGGQDNLIPTLRAFRGASPLAANWLRNAFESLAAAVHSSDRELPEQELVDFVRNTEESPIARRLAYEWLLKQNSRLKEELIPTMLLDPGAKFRRDAVAMLMEAAESAESPQQGTMLYRRALKGAVHEDQVRTIAKQLRSEGADVDIQQHFGFLTHWKIIGPFDNKDEAGYAVAYPPESDSAPDTTFPGQLGEVRWEPIATEHDFGIVDIAKQIENYKGSLMYAVTTFHSDSDVDLEIRLGTPNAWKLWVNEELVFEREEYHRNSQMDQYRVPVRFRKGGNRIMVKICQNEMTQDWAQRYQFQLRVCDSTGAAVLSQQELPDGANN